MQSYTRPKCLMPDNVVLMYSWSGVFLFSGGGLTTGTAPGSNIFTVGNTTGNYTLYNYILRHLSLPSNHATEHCVGSSLLPFAMVLIITLWLTLVVMSGKSLVKITRKSIVSYKSNKSNKNIHVNNNSTCWFIILVLWPPHCWRWHWRSSS